MLKKTRGNSPTHSFLSLSSFKFRLSIDQKKKERKKETNQDTNEGNLQDVMIQSPSEPASIAPGSSW